MKILIDIGHPAHVHYFKNFIWVMKEKGHIIDIIARDKEVAFKLLDYYKFPYFNRGKGKNGFIGKFLYLIKADLFVLRKAIKLKPDIYLSAGSMYAAHVAWILRKPHIAFDDTDNNLFQQLFYVPFTTAILTPKVFRKNFGKKHVRFNGFLELNSLHPNRFKSNPENIKDILDKTQNKPYVIFRFVSWAATHDVGLKGLSLNDKLRLVKELSAYANIIISSESKLPEELQQYAYSTHPAYIHDLLNGASLLISESLTMSAESAFIGTPTLCISTADAGTLDEEVKLGLIEIFRTSNGLLERALEIVKNNDYKNIFKSQSEKIVNKHIDLTAFTVWFVENFPSSLSTMQANPNYQYDSLSN